MVFFSASFADLLSASIFFRIFCGTVSILFFASRLSYTTASVVNVWFPKFVFIFLITVKAGSFPIAVFASSAFGVFGFLISIVISSLSKNGFFSCLIILLSIKLF